MTTPPIRNEHGDELTNFTDQLAYGVSQDPLTIADLHVAIDALRDAPRMPKEYVVSPWFWSWLKTHTVESKDATHWMMGVPVRVDDEQLEPCRTVWADDD